MNHTCYTIALLSLLACSACEKEEVVIPETDNAVNQWIEQTMRANYLWYSECPDQSALDFGLDPEAFFKSLLSDKDGKALPEGHHYFSRLEKASATKSIRDASDSYGFDFAISSLTEGGRTYNLALVLYVLEDSPAEEAGLRRGDWILGVNGSWGTIQDYDRLRSGGRVSLQLGAVVENGKGLAPTRVVTLEASRAVEDTPFLKDSVYTYGDRRIGYLMYNRFAAGPDEYDYSDTRYNLRLRQLFERFKSRGVNELVLDLRYNGGGLVNCAQLLASLLARESALGEPLCILAYNDKNSRKNETLPLLKTTEVLAGNLDLRRLFVLTGSTTASASELIINALRPYLEVRVIGKQTLGKTVGMTIYDESERYGWILSPVTFRIYNKNREADYEEGFPPDVAIDEFRWDLVPFGDLGDPLLGQALYEITGRSPRLRSATPGVDREIRYDPPSSPKDRFAWVPYRPE
ncbi:S41 family peptidase [Parabacteroides sp. ZJ-118]|uniref:S41 family peptidase n=1 Tax=Parabacteroides sp. ZJ-118 TaxID=2709398 RepID=UPI0013EA1B99|nr:S41 family peptidase [Parabacteroides sp. ZJ-118]